MEQTEKAQIMDLIRLGFIYTLLSDQFNVHRLNKMMLHLYFSRIIKGVVAMATCPATLAEILKLRT